MDDEQRVEQGMAVRRAVLGLRAGLYAGVPVANRAFAIAKRALAEYGQSGAGG